MCGIVGFINKRKKIEILNEMLEIQSYRGPDDRGVYFDEKSGVHLGHNRLSILDLSNAGHQPMVSKCNNYVIVFNGEVYNFNEIKKELLQKGYEFNSNSDTEVVLYSLIEWGIKAVDKFIGMFAIAFYDKIKQKLFLIRDRAGVKPLYYYKNGSEFLFSSEIKSFHKYPNFKKELNKEILPYYFQFGYIPSIYSIFKNCYKLEAGHYLELNVNNLEYKIKKYWDVNDYYMKTIINKSETEILKDIEYLLDDAINLRMIADVPVGIFLSGGYDSSLVVSILTKKYNKHINTFTIGFDDKKYNEAEHAKSIAKYLGTNHTEYYMQEDDMLELIDKLPFYYDEPFGDSSALPTMIVSKIAKKNVTVALSADGGDEIFGGYSKYIFLKKFNNIFSSKFKKILLQNSITYLNETIVEKINELLPHFIRQTNIKDRFVKFKRAISSDNLEMMFLNASSQVEPKLIKDIFKYQINFDIFNEFKNENNFSFLNYMMSVDYKTFMKDDVLVKVDRATMSVSLEGREPLLDHRLVEYMARVPENLKLKDGKGKYLLRQILYKYIPKQLIDKPKSGFQVPLDKWLRGKLKHLVEYYICESKIDKDIFDVEIILNLKKRFFNGEKLESIIWFILIFQMWKEKWFE